jgi:hypothetical protein
MISVAPRCTVLADAGSRDTIAVNGRVFIAERTDPNAGSNFSAFGPLNPPLGNGAITFNTTGIPDTFAINESWLRIPGAPVVFRGQATPAARQIGNTIGGATDFNGSGWLIHTQDAFGTWLAAAAGTANSGTEIDGVQSAALTVPQFMPVGNATMEMFACAGLRTEDNRARSTWLLQLTPPDPANGKLPSSMPIQDLLYGDSLFVPNAPGPLIGPPTPPVPSVTGPGDQAGTGAVLCAMSQLGDNISTRQLHMLAIRGGRLYHSMASNFGPVTQAGFTFNRFRAISPWGDVGQVLGNTFGTIRSAAIVAHPTSVSVFFYADAGNGLYKLWHAVRFASGSWRAADDVFLLSGDALGGTVYQMNVAAGNCPAFGAAAWDDTTNEMLVALSGGSNPLQVLAMRVVTTPRNWRPGVTGIYEPWKSVPSGSLAGSFYLQNVVVSARPFADNAKPTP